MGKKVSKGTRQAVPTLKVSASLAPAASSAESPASSPSANLKASPSPLHAPPYQNFSRPIANPLQQGTKTPPPPPTAGVQQQNPGPSNGARTRYASYASAVRQQALSPSSPSDDSSDCDSSDSESPPLSTSPESPLQMPRRPIMRVDSPAGGGGGRGGRVDFEVEMCGNFDPQDSDYEDALKPYDIEYPESERSRSRSRCPPRRRRSIDPQVVEKLNNMRWDDGSSEEEYDPDTDDFQNFLRQQREVKRRNRVSHGSSIGKRTISERSDSDREDLKSTDGRESPVGDRRTRRRVERWSGLYINTPPERIPELEEPNTDDEVDLARELPFCDTDLEVMEVDSD